MVGDSVEDDIEGADALGMRAFLIDREGRYPEGRAAADLGASGSARALLRPVSKLGRARRRCARRASEQARRAPRRTRPRPPRASRPGLRRRLRLRRARASPRADARDRGGELGGDRLLVRVELPLGEVRPARRPRRGAARTSARARRPSASGRRRSGRSGSRQAAGEQAFGQALEPVRDEAVRAVGHRDDEPRAAAGALALEQRGEITSSAAESARGEIGDLHGRHPGAVSASAPAQPR